MNGQEEVISIIEKWKKDIQDMHKQINSANPSSFSDLKLKKRLMSPDEDMARVNPYISYSKDFAINCTYCTAAYDLRRRGYDVEADDYGSEIKIVPDIFEIYSWWTHKSSMLMLRSFNTAVRQALLDLVYPGYRYFNTDEFTVPEMKYSIIFYNGDSRGQMSFMWKEGKAHSVVYEINYGQLILRDCQHNKKVSFEEYAEKASRIYYFRTDNEEPTTRILNGIKNKDQDSLYFNDKGSMNTLLKMFKDFGFKAVKNGDKIKVNLKHRNDLYLIIDEKGNIQVKSILLS